ncbi:hypothetical protein CVT25_005466 [Psilocybe cyanescens]|uniref:Peptidase C14 caspase domain-containing protein n=1 Tax=Psilocybe cyanescens TaxID=93625 RepID=A0A409XSB8_PSICY|nr:hypothetical protein CVT25_005466 [Psilocybe cyanescens]
MPSLPAGVQGSTITVLSRHPVQHVAPTHEAGSGWRTRAHSVCLWTAFGERTDNRHIVSGRRMVLYLRKPSRFYPPPRGIKVIPIYDDAHTYPWSHHEHRSHRSDRERSRSHSHRRARSNNHAVYTDSEYEGSGSYVPSSRSSSHGRGRSPLPPKRYHDRDYEESYRVHSRSRYPESDAYGSSHHHHQDDRDSNYLHASHYGDRAESVAHSGRSGSTVPGRHQHSRSNSDVPDIRNFLEDVQRYLKILPPAPNFCYSKCNGRKKAVCIGINYVGQKDELRGCANDARNMRRFIIDYYGFQSQNILLLVDDGHGSSSSLRPTRKEMFNAMQWLVKGAQMHDSLFFHYSGHGGQSPDASGKEADGMDEVIFPVDYDSTQDIIDDELHEELVAPLPPGCRLTHSAHGRLRGMNHISKRSQQRGVAPSADVISFAACKDDETSADTFSGGVATGAMSHAFVQSLGTSSYWTRSLNRNLFFMTERNPNQTYEELLQHLRDILIPKYHQKAQLSGTHPVVRTVYFFLFISIEFFEGS